MIQENTTPIKHTTKQVIKETTSLIIRIVEFYIKQQIGKTRILLDGRK
jgi:hypothetical protein